MIVKSAIKLTWVMAAILAMTAISSCENNDEPQEEQKAVPSDLVFVFYSPNGLGDMGYNDMVCRGVEKAAKRHNLNVQHYVPPTQESGLILLSFFLSHKDTTVSEARTLIVLADPTMANEIGDYLDDMGDNCHALLLDTRNVYPKSTSLYIDMYGAAWMAARLCSSLGKGQSVGIVSANPESQPHKDVISGLEAGFGGTASLTVESMADLMEPYNSAENLYRLSGEYFSAYDMIVPLCGGSAHGMLRYTRENNVDNYLLGMDYDMSYLSRNVPLSMLKRMDMAVEEYISLWRENGVLPQAIIHGLADGMADIAVADRYRPIFLDEVIEAVRAQALEEERKHETNN